MDSWSSVTCARSSPSPDHRSFTKAAEELFLAQSAISQQLSRLEAEIGIQIFRRSSRSVELTEEGKVILDHAKRVLAEFDDMQGEMEALTGVMRGAVRIGGIYPFGPYDLYGVLAEYRERYHADQSLTALGERDDGRRGPAALGILDHRRLAALEDGHARVRGAEVDANGLGHT